MTLAKYCLRVLSLLALVWMIGLGAVPAAAQPPCAARTDWLPYRVTYGDTLGRIATRYDSSVSALAAGNCLSNYNLIRVGQVLRVPPRPSDAPAEAFPIPVSFQQFERGFMIWHRDSGYIWVFFGRTGGQMRSLSLDRYAELPENPVTSTPPAGRFKPEFGFGKVWGNFPGIRAALGWATTPESSYDMGYSPTDSNTFYFMLPDGRAGTRTENNLWSLYTGVFPGIVTTTMVNASFQEFQGAYLLWREDTGRIEEFHFFGYVRGYDNDQYAHLSDTPIPDIPPDWGYKPVMGFGRVWTHFIDLRDRLGWGLSPEQGFVATIVKDMGTLVECMNLPNGEFISYPHYDSENNAKWDFEDDCG